MRVALVSDIHIHPFREFSEPGPEGVPTRLKDCASVLTDIGNYALDHSITALVLGGDIFHKRGVIATHPYNMVAAHLAWMKDIGLSVFVVDGNHDHADKAGRIHAVEAMASSGLVSGVNAQFGFENWHLSSDDESDELVITGMSYCDNREVFHERIGRAEEEYLAEYDETHRIFVCHHGFKNARVGSTLEYVVKEEIDAEKEFTGLKWDEMFSGHYHQRQPIGGSANMSYIGSPLEHMRGDGGQEKGFLVYDSVMQLVELVPLKRPRFVTLSQEQIEAKDFDEVVGNFVDVKYESLPKTPDEYKKLLRREGAAGVHLVPMRKAKGPTATRLDVDLSMDGPTLLAKYIDHTKPVMDRTELLRVGQELLDKSL